MTTVNEQASARAFLGKAKKFVKYYQDSPERINNKQNLEYLLNFTKLFRVLTDDLRYCAQEFSSQKDEVLSQLNQLTKGYIL